MHTVCCVQYYKIEWQPFAKPFFEESRWSCHVQEQTNNRIKWNALKIHGTVWVMQVKPCHTLYFESWVISYLLLSVFASLCISFWTPFRMIFPDLLLVEHIYSTPVADNVQINRTHRQTIHIRAKSSYKWCRTVKDPFVPACLWNYNLFVCLGSFQSIRCVSIQWWKEAR